MRKRYFMMPLAGLAVTAGALLSAGISAAPASAAAGNGCPATKAGVPVASDVTASHSTSGNVTTYKFTSLTNQNPSGGVPGLIKYCVYPTSPTGQPQSTNVVAKGDNHTNWITGAGGNNFAFMRPSGNPSNIGLDGQSHTMGTATWANVNAVPDNQAVVLHVNDPAMCASLYGAGTSTCFVRPSPPPPPGPICDHGDSNVAYNAMPTNVADCINPAEGFEANSMSEMGDSVALATGTGRTLDTLRVDLQDFACGTSGHWSGTTQDAANQPSPCLTVPGATFDHPITANIYAADASGLPGALLATDTETKTIPYRPSADPSCPANAGTSTAGAAWFNPASGHCQNSIGTVLSFNSWVPQAGFNGTLPDNVVWTVAFNTTDYGNPAVGNTTACALAVAADDQQPGCGYDSLNLGDATHANAPYAGSAFNTDQVLINQGSGLQVNIGWTNYRPLGEIITTP